MIFVFFKKRKRKKELRKKLYINKGKIYFLYKDYNQFNFDDFFKEKDISIKSVKVEGNLYNDVLLYHFSKSFTTKGFPMLIKIEENEIKIKRHFNSFKHYVKRNKDSQSFYTLLKRSIKNLE